MALPPKVVEQLAREPLQTPGWSARLLMFSATLFILSIVGYFGLSLGYARYLAGRIQEIDRQIKSQSQQIPEQDRDNIVIFFSQLSNLRLILDKHIFTSSLFALLEKTTHKNVHYSRLVMNSGKNEALLTGIATSVADVTEQVKILEDQPEIEKVSLGNIVVAGGGWQFETTLSFSPGFLSSVANAVPAPAATGGATSTSTSTPPR